MDPNDIGDFKLMVMNYEETFKHDEWKASRELADEMMETIPGLRKDFKLDQITLGNGACFFTAALQQLRRPEINEKLEPKFRQLCKADTRTFKSLVRRFIFRSKHTVVETLKADFESFTDSRMSWEHYWSSKHLMKPDTWADEMFIRATAWFLQIDIVVHQNIASCSRKTISGNIDDDQASSNGPKLHVAYLLNRHYQSILPRTTEAAYCNDFLPEEVPEVVTMEMDETSAEEQASESPSAVCPVCGKENNVLNHINKSKKCKEKVTEKQLEDLRKLSSSKTKLKKQDLKVF